MKSLPKFILKVFNLSMVVSLCVVILSTLYLLGFLQGYNSGRSQTEIKFIEMVNDKLAENRIMKASPTPTTVQKIDWSGPQLWALVNKKRVDLGVNALGQKDELCTIASLRLNELIELGKLDGHEGFGNLEKRRPDLKWVFDKYSVIAEFLASGAATPEEAVKLWENTLAHRKILDGGEFVWGCIYAQDSYAVGIAAY